MKPKATQIYYEFPKTYKSCFYPPNKKLAEQIEKLVLGRVYLRKKGGLGISGRNALVMRFKKIPLRPTSIPGLRFWVLKPGSGGVTRLFKHSHRYRSRKVVKPGPQHHNYRPIAGPTSKHL